MDDNQNTVDTGMLTDALLAEGAPDQNEQQDEQQDEQLSPEEARKAALSDGLNTLFEDGWTAEELEEFSKDAQVREDIQKNGKTVRQAARAYERRLRATGNADAKSAGKRGVPTVKSASGDGPGGLDKIAEMSDKEFEAFYKQAMADSLAGKKRRL